MEWWSAPPAGRGLHPPPPPPPRSQRPQPASRNVPQRGGEGWTSVPCPGSPRISPTPHASAPQGQVPDSRPTRKRPSGCGPTHQPGLARRQLPGFT